MELRKQIEAVEWTIHFLLELAGEGKDIPYDPIIGLNSAKGELEELMEERGIAGRR